VRAPTGKKQKATEQKHPSFDTWGRPPLWDAAGENIYLTASDDFRLTREILSKPTRSLSYISSDVLWKISLTSRLAAPLASIPNRDIEEIVSVGGNCIWSPDGGASCCIRTRDDQTKQAGFYKIALATGISAKLLEEDKSYSSVSPNGQRVAYVVQDAKRPSDVWIADSEFVKPKQLTRINPQLDQYLMGASRLIEWRGLDGQVLHGALLLPADYQEGKQYPLIVHVYGGLSGSNTVNRFGLWLTSEDNMQLLATRGYAVLLPDAPLRQGTPMQDMAKVVLPGVNRVIELGIADPDRLGVMGSSYGGYSTLALIVQTPRFKAAIMKAGTGNLFSIYGEMGNDGSMNFGVGWAEDGQGRMGGTPWDLRERYIENSPVFYLDRVRTPLFIAQGTEDDTTAPFLSDEIFVDLRRLGREVLYAKYAGEGHGFWGHANTVDYWKRMIDWFDGHLQPQKVNK